MYTLTDVARCVCRSLCRLVRVLQQVGADADEAALQVKAPYLTPTVGDQLVSDCPAVLENEQPFVSLPFLDHLGERRDLARLRLHAPDHLALVLRQRQQRPQPMGNGVPRISVERWEVAH